MDSGLWVCELVVVVRLVLVLDLGLAHTNLPYIEQQKTLIVNIFKLIILFCQGKILIYKLIQN